MEGEEVQRVTTQKNENDNKQGVGNNSVNQDLSDFVRKHIDEIGAEDRSVGLINGLVSL